MEPFTTLVAAALVFYGCWQAYMITKHPDTYMKMREQDRQHRKDLAETVGKHVAPTALRMFVKFLKW